MNKYLNKYAIRAELINEPPAEDLGIIVVIPCKNEPNLLRSLQSLSQCIKPDCSVEVIIVFNAAEDDSEDIKMQNINSLQNAKPLKNTQNPAWLKFHFILENELPKKHAGVGLARKIGMDEAVRRFEEIEKPEGIIACFDADSTCEINYFSALHAHFQQHPKTPGCSIKFEHPTSGDEYDTRIYTGIINYELHLRYYKQAMRYTGYPYSFHTVGSSMAVRSIAYQKQGGMNRRQAGEDFYFLHKIIALGNFTELNNTCIFPSPRISDRVPFGTGRAIGDYVKSGNVDLYTNSFKSFQYLRQFFLCIPEFYLAMPKLEELRGSLPSVVIDFLNIYFFDDRLQEIKSNSSNINSFVKRFYTWFNAFMILKFVHYVRDHSEEDVIVNKAAKDLLRAIKFAEAGQLDSSAQLLQVYRRMDEHIFTESIF